MFEGLALRAVSTDRSGLPDAGKGARAPPGNGGSDAPKESARLLAAALAADRTTFAFAGAAPRISEEGLLLGQNTGEQLVGRARARYSSV